MENNPNRKPTSHEFEALQDSVVELNNVLQERDKREAELTLAQEKSEAANQAKSSFLANMSHEIRTPMNGVIGLTQLLLMTDLHEDQKGYVTTIAKSGKTLMAIIDDILDYSKMEAGKVVLQSVPFSLSQTIKDILLLLSPLSDEKNLNVTISVSETVPLLLKGDPARFTQIMTNVVGNAIKYTPQGSVDVDISCEVTNGLADISITIVDTGIGISPSDLDRIFHKFEQVDSGFSRSYGGTGLGLAITAFLVEQLNGTISVTSELNVGSTFVIRISFPVFDQELSKPSDREEFA